MLFNEVYSSYFNAVSEILSLAADGRLDKETLYETVRKKGFAESTLTIPQKLADGTWPLLKSDYSSELRNKPEMPLTELQRRWLAALLSDPRIKLFEVGNTGLSDTEPLYEEGIFVYYDRYTDGDPFEDEEYIAHFQTVLTSLREKKKLKIRYKGHRNTIEEHTCIPTRLEYSSKDDKFRLIATCSKRPLTVKLASIENVSVLGEYTESEAIFKKPEKRTAVLELYDERNAPERVLLHFSHFDKEACKTGENAYRLTLRYDCEDETELVIRVLSFGPVLRVLSPDSLIDSIKCRMEKQKKLLMI